MLILKKLPNNEIIKFSEPDDNIAILAATRGCIRPQDFIYHDKAGVIQDEHNIPILYHWSRHKFNKKIPNIEVINNNPNKLKYSKSIPDIDTNDKSRLHSKYWWLNSRLECIKKLSTRFKNQRTEML